MSACVPSPLLRRRDRACRAGGGRAGRTGRAAAIRRLSNKRANSSMPDMAFFSRKAVRGTGAMFIKVAMLLLNSSLRQLTLDERPHGLLVVDVSVQLQRGAVPSPPQTVVRLHAEVVRVRNAGVLVAAVDGVQHSRLTAPVHHLGTVENVIWSSSLGVRRRAQHLSHLQVDA